MEQQATLRYLAQIEEDIMPVDGLIEFAESDRCAKIFGDKQDEEIAHAYSLKSQGAKYCDCPACTAALTILERKNEIIKNI